MTKTNKIEIYEAFKNRKETGKTIREIAKDFSISVATVYNIRNNFEETPEERNSLLQELNNKIDKLIDFFKKHTGCQQ